MAPRNDKPASSADLAAVEAGLKSDISAVEAGLKSDISAVKTELKSDISAVKTELKSDISAVKTELKSDISAVKSELKTDITRLDLKIDKVAMELVKTQGSLRTLAETMATKDDIGRVLKAIDSFAGKLETYGRETVLIPNALDAHGKALADHERRLVELERP